ncbi:undecaprenyldiphospho-muramoylpentapeptide beta-N-acetylglucosaminyltransferase [Kineococcus gynurae]|uniref:UDP-N-acetylglucosamine--N-acetylmuramyl-(pentapeptide) pyrophosphoryl-undecaprenol N-acetylglucosamine transferase n=1 Tax=Kineococcus gynurae TaxID=452979 RepID=A0ABV5LXT0_9ACTN
MSAAPERGPAVLLAGGGTAGHVAPLLATAERLREELPDVRLLVLGTAEGLEARLVPERGFELALVPRVPLPRKPSVDLLRLPGRLAGAVGAARAAIRRIEADVVVGFGGYVATPAYLAARRAGVPVVVHEQNSLPGIANRVGARWAQHVAVTFPGTPLPRAEHTGMPLRREITALAAAPPAERARARSAARLALGLDPDRPTLLVTGGSLGAQRLNEVLPQAAAELLAAGGQVLHAAGRGKEVRLGDLAHPEHYQVRPYLDDMGAAYAAADLVLGRSGAGTVSELTALGLPGVYVPLPIGNGEQARNAAAVVEAGGGMLVADADLDATIVRERVLPLLTDPSALGAAARAAAAFGVHDGDARLVALVRDAMGARS